MARRRVRRNRSARRKVVRRRRLTGRQQSIVPYLAGVAAQHVASRFAGSTSGVGAKRKRVAPGQRRRNEGDGTGSYSQWTQAYRSARFGKLTPRKIDSLSLNRVVFTHRMLGPFNDYGQVYLKNYIRSDGTQEFPLMLMELNSCNNLVLGSVVNHAPVRTLYQYPDASTSAKKMLWGVQPSLLANGTSDSTGVWQLETSGGVSNAAHTYPHESAIHKWSSIDLELWGCKNKPTKYHIALCQFSEDVLPDWGDRADQSAEFWQSLIKHYTYSPMAKIDDGFNRKKIKILKQYTYNIDPTASYENDPDPHVKTVKLFYKFNRKCNFSWMFAGPEVQTIADMNDEDWRREHGQNQNQVHPNARLYLMIRASNFTQVTHPAVVDNTTNPSISWRLRSCFLVNG